MIARHYQLFTASQDSFKAICEAARPVVSFGLGRHAEHPLLAISPPGDDDNRLYGKIVRRVTLSVDDLHPTTLVQTPRLVEVLRAFRFVLDQHKGLVYVEGKRTNLNVLFEELDNLPDAYVTLEDLNLNLPELLDELRQGYPKHVLKSLRLRDYIARENMLATAGFKPLDQVDVIGLVERFSDQIDAFNIQIKLPDGPCALSLNRKGTLRASGHTPDELLDFVRDLLPRYHESEVETAGASIQSR